MIRKLVLLGLLSICTTYSADISQEPVKKRRKISLWFKAIIPSILSGASLEAFIRSNRGNPDRQNLVRNAEHARFLPMIIGCYCLNMWMQSDLKEWMLRKAKSTKE